jgi:BlaR1 peptidase M56.
MSFLYDVLALSIGITPLILILLLLSRVLQKYYSARWRYAMWTAIAIRLLLPVSWISPAPVAIEIPAAFTPGPPAAGSPVPLIHTALPPAAAISPGQIFRDPLPGRDIILSGL